LNPFAALRAGLRFVVSVPLIHRVSPNGLYRACHPIPPLPACLRAVVAVQPTHTPHHRVDVVAHGHTLADNDHWRIHQALDYHSADEAMG
jgi:hypothetical protein